VPYGKGEHPAQGLHALGALLFVQVQDRLRVRVRLEPVPAVDQEGAQAAVVVDLSVKDDRAGAVLIKDRLMAAGHVDDAQPPEAQTGIAVDVVPVVVRAAMDDRVRHLLEQMKRHRLTGAEVINATNPAHTLPLPYSGFFMIARMVGCRLSRPNRVIRRSY